MCTASTPTTRRSRAQTYSICCSRRASAGSVAACVTDAASKEHKQRACPECNCSAGVCVKWMECPSRPTPPRAPSHAECIRYYASHLEEDSRRFFRMSKPSRPSWMPAFWASLRREENYTPRISLAFVDRTEHSLPLHLRTPRPACVPIADTARPGRRAPGHSSLCFTYMRMDWSSGERRAVFPVSALCWKWSRPDCSSSSTAAAAIPASSSISRSCRAMRSKSSIKPPPVPTKATRPIPSTC